MQEKGHFIPTKVNLDEPELAKIEQSLQVELYDVELQRRQSLWQYWLFGILLVAAVVALLCGIILLAIGLVVEAVAASITIPSIILLIISAVANSILFSDYRQKIKNIFIPAFIKACYPHLDYQPFMHIESYKIQKALGISDPYTLFTLEKGEDYLSGKIGQLQFELSEGLLRSGEGSHIFQGIMIFIHQVPSHIDLDWIKQQSDLAKEIEALSSFWGKTPYWERDEDNNLCLFIQTQKSFLEIWPNEHFLKSKLFRRIQLELYHCLHIVEQLDRLITISKTLKN